MKLIALTKWVLLLINQKKETRSNLIILKSNNLKRGAQGLAALYIDNLQEIWQIIQLKKNRNNKINNRKYKANKIQKIKIRIKKNSKKNNKVKNLYQIIINNKFNSLIQNNRNN